MGVFGLTGNFASGKTTVLQLLKNKGANVFDCDNKIHEYYRDKNSSIYKKIAAAFPKVIKRGRIQRDILGKEVFFNKSKLSVLEDIVHPVIKQDLLYWIDEAKKKEGIYIAEVPLLFEKKWDRYFDGAILVLAPVANAIKRIMKDHQLSRQEALDRLALYIPIIEKIEKADFIINNNLGIKELKKEVNLLWKNLK